MRKSIIWVQICLFLALAGSLTAETINFPITEYTFDKVKQEVRHLGNGQTAYRYYRNFQVPLITVTQNNLYAVPHQLQIIKTKTKAVLTGLNFNSRSRDSLQVYENYTNIPAAIGSAGFARGNGILNLEFSPFIFSHDTLFFVESIEYKLTDYQLSFLPTGKISEESDLLIIAPGSAVSSLEPYRRFKEQNGLRTQIVSIEDICNSTEGMDKAHRIRNYIKKCYRNQKIKYVLLAGSAVVIPAVIFKNDAAAEAVPSDHFYSNLDKEFDSNSNGIYADNNDQVDYYPDVVVGRWPGTTTAEIRRMADKSVSYQSDSISSRNEYYQSQLLAAFNLFTPGDSEAYCEMVKQTCSSGLSATDSLYHNSSPGFSESSVYNAFNLGYNLVYVQAHGNTNKFGVDGGWGIYSDHLYYTNAVSGLYFIASCHPGDFAANGVVTKAMLSPNGGCVNYIGTSGLEYPSMSQTAHKMIMQNMINHDKIGDALTKARITGFPSLNTSQVTRQLYYGYNLQGDPSSYFFMHQPQKVQLTNISGLKKGHGVISGQLDAVVQTPLTITLSSARGVLGYTTTANSFFSISYDNLFEDSVVLSVASPDVFFSKTTLLTSSADQDLQVRNVQIKDANNSGIVEFPESFKLSLELQAVSQPQTDSLRVNLNCSALNLVMNKNIKSPDAGQNISLDIFDITPDLSALQADTALAFSLRIYPYNLGKDKPQQPVFTGSYLLPVANPKLEISWVKYLDNNIVIPVLHNRSAGKINEAVITLSNPTAYTQNNLVFGSKQQIPAVLPPKDFMSAKETKPKSISDLAYKNSQVTLKNIPGNTLLTDSLIFFCQQDKIYQLEIRQSENNSYLSRTFTRSAENSAISDTLKFNTYSIGRNLNINWSRYKANIKFNLYVYTADTLTVKQPVNSKPLSSASYDYQLESDLPADVYIKIGLIDDSSAEEFAFSKFYHVNPIAQYKQAPYSLLPFQLYNPVKIDDRIIANSESGCIVSLPADGENVTSDGSLYNSLTHGVQNDFLQGRAIGDINGDGQKDIISLTWCNYDSIYLQAVDLQTGELLAKQSIYGYGKFNTPVLADIDQDPEQEILLTAFNGPHGDTNVKGGYLYAFDLENGQFCLKPGYPLISTKSSFIIGAPVVADLDNNGSRELIVDNGSFLIIYNLSDLTKIVEFDLGKQLTGDLVVCDIDNDSRQEIICTLANAGGAASGRLRVLKFSANTISDAAGFSDNIELNMNPHNFYKPGSSPVPADIDLDGTPEIITVTGKKLYVFSASGQPFGAFPVNLPLGITDNNINAPSLADLNGDGKLDVLFMDGNARIHAYSGSNATKLPGFPLYVPGGQKNHFGSLNIADLDHDGDLEILCGAKGGQLYIFDYPLQSSNREIYSYHRGDPANSGFFRRTDTVSIQNQDNRPADFAILSQYPNPFNPVTSINFVVPGAEEVQFKVFNSLGQLVYQEKNFYPKSGLQTIQFNGSSLSSGLYIYSLKYGQQVKIGKCALLK